jgi:hypothetical protein
LKEEKVKSALEIAMEKVSGLPELTREEIRQQQEKEYGPVGEALAKKYLSGTISDQELLAELAGHSGMPGRIVRRALASGLCGELRSENDRQVGARALKGLKFLASERSEAVGRIGDEFWKLVDEFNRKKRENSRQFEVLAVERLRELGISGSAVRPNLGEDAHWKKALREFQNAYEPRLADIRRRLMQELQ